MEVGKLGRTLTHEHLAAEIEGVFYTPPPSYIPIQILQDNDLKLENIGLVKQYPYSNRENIRFNDLATKDAVLWEMELYRNCGGGSIVENSSYGLQRDLELMVKISKQTGVNVIAGTGFYVHQSQSTAMLNKNVEELCNIIRTDLTEGCPEMPEVRCGVIAEVGSVWPIHAFEKRAIEATAILQAETGCAVSFHPGRNCAAPAEIARIYLEAGGDKEKAVMSHLDRTISDKASLLDFANSSGFYCQYDLFGIETSLYQLDAATDMPSDAQRLDRIKWLIDDGKTDKILMSHDVHTKHRLIKYGGHGFSHILLNVTRQMENKGILCTENIFTVNPANWLGVSTNYQPRRVTLG